MKHFILFLILTSQAHAFFNWFARKKAGTDSANLNYPNMSPSDYGHRWKNEWTLRVYQQLDNPDLSRFMYDPAILSVETQKLVGCPKFLFLSPQEKKAFWAIFIASMSNKEGRHKEKAYINPTDHKRRNVGASVGLLQIDSLNASEAGCKKDDGTKLSFKATNGKVAKPADEISMRDPMLNIKCGMYILQEELMSRAGRLISPRSYWSILRPSGKDDEAFLKLLNRDLAQIKNCQEQVSTTKKTENRKLNESRNPKQLDKSVLPSKNSNQSLSK